jgi:glycosyltransferase involved in cell wall biosynthesis
VDEMNWCVVIPTYNNGQTLEKVINDVLQVTSKIIVVNDGSSDDTYAILQRFPQISVVSYLKNKGKGYALRKGFELALNKGFQYAVTIDSDGQHRAPDIRTIVAAHELNAGTLIVGARTLPKEKLSRGSGFANKFSNFWFRFIAGVNLPDTQSGFRLYPIGLLRNIRFYTRKYEFELEVLIRSAWKGIHITSVPIDVYYPAKEDRVSHFRPFRDFIRISLLNAICFFIAVLYVKPFAFLHYLRKESVRGFIKKNIAQTGDSPVKTTFSVMLGIFMGIVPIWGYQLITAIALAYMLRLNKFIVIVAANISIPPMIPVILYLSYLTGNIALGAGFHITIQYPVTLTYVMDNLFQYVMGSIIFASVLSLLAGVVTYTLLKLIKRTPKIND